MITAREIATGSSCDDAQDLLPTLNAVNILSSGPGCLFLRTVTVCRCPDEWWLVWTSSMN